MQSRRKLGFQNRDARKYGPVEIWSGRFYSPAACWIPFFIKISFSFWPPFSHHESGFFYPMPFQGSYKLNSQLLISLVNAQSSSSFSSDLKWFLSEDITTPRRAIGCLIPTCWRSEHYQWSCSESFQPPLSEQKVFGVSLRIWMQKDLGILGLCWHFQA